MLQFFTFYWIFFILPCDCTECRKGGDTHRKRLGFTLLILFIFAYVLSNLLVGVALADNGGDLVDQSEDEAAAVTEELESANNLDTVWILVAGFLVFFMQAGFALVEAGFVRARNVVNIFMKNLFDLSVGAICY